MSRYPSYCCQRCGSAIGWIMVLAEMIFGQFHDCDGPAGGEG